MANMGNHLLTLNQLAFLAVPLITQQLKILAHSLTYTSPLEHQDILAQGPFTLRWPAS